MDSFKPRKTGAARPEAKIQAAIKDFLTLRGWYVRSTHGSAFSQGWPDLFVCHSRYGIRWVEVKLPKMKGSHFTAAQIEDFPKFIANGAPIWIMTAATEHEYKVLFEPSNYWKYKSGLVV